MPANNPHLTFCIPLQSKKTSKNWDEVCHLLNNTLTSLEGQIDKRFSVILACHDKPIIKNFSFDIKFLQATWTPGTENNEKLKDKRLKRLMLFREVRERGGGFAMLLDADDLVSRNLVGYALNENDPNGYIIEQGYAFDAAAQLIAPIPGAWSKTFDSVCGSCAIIRFGLGDLPDKSDEDREKLFYALKSHSDWKHVMSSRGRPLKKIPFRAAVYVLNHNNNLHFSIAEHRFQSVPTRIENNSIEITFELIEEFSLPI